MGIKDEVAEIIRGNKANPMNENKSTRIHNLYLSAIEGEEGFEPECTDTRHDDRWCPHCSSMAMGIDAFISHLKEVINGNKG